MKHFIIFSICRLLVFIGPVSQALASDPAVTDTVYADHLAGQEAGKAAALHYHGDAWWILGGFGGGLVAGPLGAGIMMGVSQTGTPRPGESDGGSWPMH
jgi:hypothetical protein